MQPTIPEGRNSNPPNSEKSDTEHSNEKNARPEITVCRGDPGWPTLTEWMLIVISLVVLLINLFVFLQVREQTEAMKIQADASKTQADASIEQTRLTASALDLAKQTSISSDSVSTRSIALAEKSLDEARKTNAFQEKVTRLGTRAYIAIEDPKYYIKWGVPFMVSVIVKNLGKSPADHVYDCGTTLADTSKADITMREAKEVCERHKGIEHVLIPGSSYQRFFHFGPPLQAKDSVAIKNIGPPELVMGRVVYTDVFNKEHFVQFCFWYDTSTDKYLLYDRFNGAD